MILKLRHRHQLIFLSLALLLPAAFIASLWHRPTRLPAAAALPAVENDGAALSVAIFSDENLWAEAQITTRVFADTVPPRQMAIELQPAQALPAADILVYWSAELSSSSISSLDNAFLLGTLAGTQSRRWLLPAPALEHAGQLFLYSLAEQRLLAHAKLPLLPLAGRGGRE